MPNSNVHIWKPYNSDAGHVQYLDISEKEATREGIHRMRRVNFWSQLLPKLVEYDQNLYRMLPELQRSSKYSFSFHGCFCQAQI